MQKKAEAVLHTWLRGLQTSPQIKGRVKNSWSCSTSSFDRWGKWGPGRWGLWGFFVLLCFSKDLACVWVRQGTGPSSTSLPETQPRALSTSHKHVSPWTWSSFLEGELNRQMSFQDKVTVCTTSGSPPLSVPLSPFHLPSPLYALSPI